jgi:hypothetical protein
MARGAREAPSQERRAHVMHGALRNTPSNALCNALCKRMMPPCNTLRARTSLPQQSPPHSSPCGASQKELTVVPGREGALSPAPPGPPGRGV